MLTKEIWNALKSKYKAEEEGYRKKIIHSSEDYSLEQLQKHLRIEEESRLRDRGENSSEGTSKSNAVEKSEPPTKSNKRKPSRNFNKSKKKTKGGCFVCGKSGHYTNDCRHRKRNNSKVHGSYDKSLFKTYQEVDGDQEIQMGNEVQSKVIGKGNIDIIFTFGKTVSFTNVLHVPEMNRNLVSGNLLEKWGIKCVCESGKLVLSLKGNFVGKCYSCDEMKGRKPNIEYFKVWGCLTYCKNTNPIRTKLGPRGIKCVFVGYVNNSKSSRLLNLETNMIIESSDVKFFEDSLSSEGYELNVVRTISFVLQVEIDPKTYKEAMTSHDSIFWKDAIKDEMDLMLSNKTWELVDLSPGSKPIGFQCTRPDIAYVISKLSRSTSNKSNYHWKVIGRVLGYLKKTKKLGLQYTKFPAVLEGFTDASWISSTNESKSTLGWVFTLGVGAVSWKSKKQTCITHSTMESKFVALSDTGKEVE
ncbi:uncharacterized protein LOC111406071 [Olea europaea var. sylvestris]|uniref:uncharacterized protein LOC111406071 n=1 Tax=Olea europaea var. sylvestris TaxID=158386 RepID=UPI000C1D6518|nr:uncharacterized protein LOC111406071 [Olea europaea var. sylvestris]